MNRSIRHAMLAGAFLVMAISASIQASTDGAQQTAYPTINGPLTLADAVQTALKNNPMVGASASQVKAAQARTGMARAMTKPQLAVAGFAGTSTMGDVISSPPGVMPSSIFSVPDRSGITAQAGLMVPIFTGGRLSGAVKNAEALSAAAASDEVSVKQNTALEAKSAYHKALLAQSSMEVYENLVNQAQERVRIAEASFKEGRVAKYDLLRNQAGLAEAQQQLVNAQRDAQVAVVELKSVLGVSQASDIKLADRLEFAPVKENLDAYTAQAIRNRPELAFARARVKAASESIGAAKGAFKPQVYASAMQGISASSGDTTTGLTLGITVGIPIVDGGQRREAVNEAQAMLGVMKQDEKQAYLDINRDVNMVWAELQAAEKNTELSDAAVVQADEDYRVIRLRYESGKAVNVEVLDALASLVRAQNNRLMALYEHNVARDRLARAIGSM